MAVDLTATLGPLTLKNPVLTASGTFGFGEEYAAYFDLGRLGGITVKGTTLLPRHGNAPPRVMETPAGMLNAIGLQNPGVDAVIAHKLPWLRQFDTAVIVNISGDRIEEYVEAARRLQRAHDQSQGGLLAAIELNVSCPNVKTGGMAFGVDPVLTRELVTAVREVTRLPLLTKLSPNVTDIVTMARAAVEGGSDGLSLINTLLGMSIDVQRRRPMLANVTGGLSGPAIRPVAVRMVWQVARELAVPIVGMGGIVSAHDALEFILAGASAIAVGTANFVDPLASIKVLEGLEQWCEREGVTSLQELVGAAQR
jgi:dihydroorotate dehydrogenase (NAD+) catalytic subunit